MKNRHKKMQPKRLLPQVKKPATRPSGAGYANSAVYSKNSGASEKENVPAATVAVYNCHKLKKMKMGNYCVVKRVKIFYLKTEL